MDEQFIYRFMCRGKGIYEAVDEDCPRQDPRRKHKPDGSWLPKVGDKYPSGLSFWKDFGLQRYKESGLMEWHQSVLSSPIEIIKIAMPKKVFYEDQYQVILEIDD